MGRRKDLTLNTAFIAPGNILLFQDEEKYVAAEVSNTQVLARRLSDQSLKLFAVDDLPTLIRQRQLVISEAPDPTDQAELLRCRTLETLSPREKQEFVRRWPFLREVMERRPSSNAEWDEIGNQVGQRPGAGGSVTGRTVRNWWNKFEKQRGRGVNAMAPDYQRRGHRNRLPPEHRGIFDDAIWDGFLSQPGQSASEAYRYYKAYVAKRNEEKSSKTPLTPVAVQTFTKYLRNNYHPFDIEVARRGLKSALRKWSKRGLAPKPSKPLETVIVDCTRADIFVIIPQLNIRVRPWLTLVIDWATRVILHVLVTIIPPSEDTLFSALRIAFNPKGERRQELGLPGEGCHGVAVLILVDNALEFHSNSMKIAAAALGFTIEYHPKGQPWMKGVGERAFRTLNQFIHAQPGTTMGSIEERGSYDSEGNAKFELVEFEGWLGRVVELINNSPHREIAMSPYEAWRNGEKAAQARWIRDVDDAHVMLHHVVDCNHGPDGVQIAGLLYDSAALRYFYSGATVPIDAWMDRGDIGIVWLRPKGSPNIIEVPAIFQSYATGLSLAIHQELRRRRAELLRAAATEPEYLAALCAYVDETKRLTAASERPRVSAAAKHLVKRDKHHEPIEPASLQDDPVASPETVPMGDLSAPVIGEIVDAPKMQHRSKIQKASKPKKPASAHSEKPADRTATDIPPPRNFDYESAVDALTWGSVRGA